MYIKPFIKIWHKKKKEEVYMKFHNLTGIKQDKILLDQLKLLFFSLFVLKDLCDSIE